MFVPVSGQQSHFLKVFSRMYCSHNENLSAQENSHMGVAERILPQKGELETVFLLLLFYLLYW